ncbi:MAG TPA: hypothetical protein VFB73_18750 [Chloroflexota bacterium]|nr:hypothetical protein [Chloroflexota bacterium]
MYFGNRGSLTGPPFAALDRNVTNGGGPETITIARLAPGQYTYAVHNFSNDAPLGGSGARVEVRRGDALLGAFSAPAGSGRWWTVFTLDGATGAIAPVNALRDTPPLPSAVQALAPVACERVPSVCLAQRERGDETPAREPERSADARGSPLDAPADGALGEPLRPLVGTLAPAFRLASRADLPAGSAPAAARVAGQDLGDQATLETRRPEVQWSPAGATEWQAVPDRQTVRAGDRARTGPGAAARLIYFEGTAIELGPETGLLVQRLERSPEGSLITRLFQAAGTTLSRVVQLVDPAGRFELETPAATALIRGTDLRVAQRATPPGAPRQFLFQNLTSPPGANPVEVCGGPGGATCRTIRGGQETLATEGVGPGPVADVGTTDRQSQEAQRQQALDASAALAAAQAQQQLAAAAQAEALFGQALAQEAARRVFEEALRSQPTLASPPIPSDQLRIVLTWGTSPSNLDAHLWVPESSLLPSRPTPSRRPQQ